jgi:predicted enzyme related to lactoylglutathione lyase
LGNSWQYLKSYVFDFAWGTSTYSDTLNGNKNVESRIFITHDPELKGHQKTRERWKQTVHLYYSDDFFKTQKNALDAGNSIVMTNHYMFVAKAISSQNVKIHVSRAEEGFLNFRLARMPKSYHITDHFTVMDTSEKSVFLYVSDHRWVEPVGNLFISDGMGYRFTHSLENIIKGGGVDFETIESMDGTFIANRYDSNHNTDSGTESAGHLQSISEDEVV